MKLVTLWGTLLRVFVCPTLAQESPSYKISDRTFNAGGHPEAGTVLTSASYRITLDALGDIVSRTH